MTARQPPVIVLRPEPGTQATCKAARALGLDARAFPLFVVRPVAWQPPLRKDVDALLLGSANALRQAGPALEGYRGLPAYTVGQRTAEAAHSAGLNVVATGRGGLQVVLRRVDPLHRRLLRLAGRERIVLDVPDGITMETRVVYASEAQDMPEALVHLLQAPALVLLHSGEAARVLAQACESKGLARNAIHLAAIGPRVGEAAGTGWASLRCAREPCDTALLALAGQMCQDIASRC